MKIPTKTRIRKTNPSADKTGLHNCKTRDLWPGNGIPKDTIVLGTQGFAVTECNVPKVTGITVEFQPNARALWKNQKLDCMVKPGAPQQGIVKGPNSRAYNYIVAKTSSEELKTLEIARFKNQGKDRRAELI